MKRVLLVNTNREHAPYPVPPLGLAMLASALEGLYEVRIFDGMFRDPSILPQVITEFQPDYVGVSIRNIDDIVMDRTVYYIDDIVNDFIRPVRAATSVPMILGGSGFSIFPGELMKLTGADYGITGEGEVLLPRLLNLLDQKMPAPKLLPEPGFRPAEYNIQPSALDLRLDFAPYAGKGAYSIQTKRGCSHGCIYCTYPCIEGNTLRVRKPVDIAEEIRQVHHRLGSVLVEFVDSTFNDPAGHAEDICRAIIKTGVKMRFRTMGINPRNTSKELFRLMKMAGFVQIDVTPDTASPHILGNLKKGFSQEDIRRTAEMIREVALPTMWFFLFGGPGEDEVTVRETLDFIDQSVAPEDMVHMSSGLRIYPGTPLHRIALKEGSVRPDQDLLYPCPYYFSTMIAKERLDEMLFTASRSHPNYIPAKESVPPPEMMAEAMLYRKKANSEEPMFRTLIRIRRNWLEEGRI